MNPHKELASAVMENIKKLPSFRQIPINRLWLFANDLSLVVLGIRWALIPLLLSTYMIEQFYDAIQNWLSARCIRGPESRRDLFLSHQSAETGEQLSSIMLPDLTTDHLDRTNLNSA